MGDRAGVVSVAEGVLLNNALGPKFRRNRRMHANMKGSTLIFEVTSALRNY